MCLFIHPILITFFHFRESKVKLFLRGHTVFTTNDTSAGTWTPLPQAGLCSACSLPILTSPHCPWQFITEKHTNILVKSLGQSLSSKPDTLWHLYLLHRGSTEETSDLPWCFTGSWQQLLANNSTGTTSCTTTVSEHGDIQTQDGCGQ